MDILTIKDLDLREKPVFMRVDPLGSAGYALLAAFGAAYWFKSYALSRLIKETPA